MESEIIFVEAGLEAGRGDNEMIKGKSGHKRGSPGPHVALAVMTDIRKKISDPSGQQLFDRFISLCTSPQAVEKLIPVFFLAKCHGGKTHKMVWHDVSEHGVVTTILTEALKETKAVEKEGTRPRNSMARRLRAWLQKGDGAYS